MIEIKIENKVLSVKGLELVNKYFMVEMKGAKYTSFKVSGEMSALRFGGIIASLGVKAKYIKTKSI